MEKYTLVGVDGNAFAIIGYTSRALKNEGLQELIGEMKENAMGGDYQNLLRVCIYYVEKAWRKKYILNLLIS